MSAYHLPSNQLWENLLHIYLLSGPVASSAPWRMLLLCTHFTSGYIKHIEFSSTAINGRQRHQQGWWPDQPQHQLQGSPTPLLKKIGRTKKWVNIPMVVAGSVSGEAITRSLIIAQRLFIMWPIPSFLASTFTCVYPIPKILDLQDIKPFWIKIRARTLQKIAPKNKLFKISANCSRPAASSCMQRGF